MELKGIHHVSALTKNAEKNYHFYTSVMGMRLIKKTVNQDDISVYHLFYGDGIGTPGTEFTFFEIPNAGRAHPGTNSISETSLRVRTDAALDYWKNRFARFSINHGQITERFGRKVLPFTGFEEQRLLLVSDESEEGTVQGSPWVLSPVPPEYGIVGLGPVKLTVTDLEATSGILSSLLGFSKKGTFPSIFPGQRDIEVYETGGGGIGAEVHLEERKDLPKERLGRGGVHHVAFRVSDEQEMMQWINKVQAAGIPNSGFVDRFYFRSLYFREPNGILFELATDGPGFATDEELEHLGESLALPPFLEEKRPIIEAKLKPLKTKK
ncbi:ring-cleaving dioxygenase [Bacillus sp. V5-8f]|uniref:ring-cleaving dioxygenase n=1 Tax=Bacillus sp. V5-8f TaxID=2053044 RepID=UPI000C787C1D|nr:ring-cleaving dioxygenase [Bacillus sp. V5-8f]PLT35071.1 ring-cleaving dioxygenase [Bacillus sp. V5-8f]